MKIGIDPRRIREFLRRITIRQYITCAMLVIIVTVIGFLSTVSYAGSEAQMITENQYLEMYTEKNLEKSLVLVNKGLKLYDDALNNQLRGTFPAFLDAYDASGGDPAAIDLVRLKTDLSPRVDGRLDLYVINESGVIIGSTVPEVMGLDFRNYPEFYRSITAIRLGDSFYADQVVRSVESTEEGTVTGTLRKFAYMPTPDHRYLLELGLESDAFARDRASLSFVSASTDIRTVNPNIVAIRIFDVNRNLLLEEGVDAEITRDPVLRQRVDTVFATRTPLEVDDPANMTRSRFIFVDLRSNTSATDMSVVAELTYSDALLQQRLSGILLFHVIIGVLAILMGIVFAFTMAGYMAQPIGLIVEDADAIARGDLTRTIRPVNGAELSHLQESLNLMITRIIFYHEQIEREAAQLRIASDIQRAFIPAELPPIPGIDLAAVTLPAREVGGDFYDVIALGPGRYGIAIADVAGKGIPAALFMAVSRTTLRASARSFGPVAAAVTDANQMIAADSTQGMFVTLCFGVLDSREMTFTYTNGGHNPPIFFKGSSGEMGTLPPTGPALGAIPDFPYTQRSITLGEGDILVFYTDGVTEAIDHAGEEFGVGRLNDLVRSGSLQSAATITAAITGAVSRFAAGLDQFDDITLVVLKVVDSRATGVEK